MCANSIDCAGGMRQGGFTLVEAILAIVIVGIGVGGVLMAIGTTVKSSADPMVRKQMLSVAETMLEEILLKSYAPGPGTINPATCSRVDADDIADYHGYGVGNGCGQPRDLAGNPIPELSGYAVAIAVDTGAALAGLSSDAARISVTVSHGSESLSLVGYRTNYAK